MFNDPDVSTCNDCSSSFRYTRTQVVLSEVQNRLSEGITS